MLRYCRHHELRGGLKDVFGDAGHGNRRIRGLEGLAKALVRLVKDHKMTQAGILPYDGDRALSKQCSE